MEKKPLKGIKAAFRSLRSNKTLTNQEIEVLSTFADKFTTVSTHPGERCVSGTSQLCFFDYSQDQSKMGDVQIYLA